MLQKFLDAARLDSSTCAGLLGISPSVFSEWAAGQRPIPESYVPLLAAVLGVKPSDVAITPKQSKGVSMEDITPAIWYKFRGDDFDTPDRECVVLIRQLGYFTSEIEELSQSRSLGWKSLFEDIRRQTDLQAPPREQGRQAARWFCQSRGLSHGANAVGDVIRGNLRSMGLIVIESPFPESRLEGCCFFVGPQSSQRPCVFANSYKTTWFRRNAILAHEVAHAIFDAESDGASIDIATRPESDALAEVRAEAFAQEVLVPKESLRHIALRNHVKWESLTDKDLAILVASLDVEQRLVLRAALDASFIDHRQAAIYSEYDIAAEVRKLTKHALDTEQFLRTLDAPAAWVGKRNTTVPSRRLRLPSSYINSVLVLAKEGEISYGKCAELLMIDDDTFQARFGEAMLTEA